MATLKFDLNTVRVLARHAMGSPRHRVGYGAKPPGKPQLMFVKDEGVYLMSNGLPPIYMDGKVGSGRGERGQMACYAEGFDARNASQAVRATIWEKARAELGGDDFVEYVDFETILPAIEDPSNRWLVGVIGESEMDWFCALRDPDEGRPLVFNSRGRRI